MNLDDIAKALEAYEPMTLEEAKRRREVFLDRYGNELVRTINAGLPTLTMLVVSREVLEAIEEAFQHWPMVDENGEEYVGNCCFRDPKVPYDHVLFKGIPIVEQRE
jgi:hypothetical protein